MIRLPGLLLLLLLLTACFEKKPAHVTIVQPPSIPQQPTAKTKPKALKVGDLLIKNCQPQLNNGYCKCLHPRTSIEVKGKPYNLIECRP
jgi:hypothetical protein